MNLIHGFNEFTRYKTGKPKSTVPPQLPPAQPPPTSITSEQAKAGEGAGRKLRKKSGRQSSRLSRPELSAVPATVAAPTLKTKLGATA